MSAERKVPFPTPINENLTPEQKRGVVRLYKEYEEKLIEALSEGLGISPEKLTEALYETGVKTKPQRRIELPIDEIALLYEDENKSLRWLANKYEVSHGTIQRRLLEHGVGMRKATDPRVGLPVDELVYYFEKEKKSLRWLAEKNKVSPSTIQRRLLKRGVDTSRRAKTKNQSSGQ